MVRHMRGFNTSPVQFSMAILSAFSCHWITEVTSSTTFAKEKYSSGKEDMNAEKEMERTRKTLKRKNEGFMSGFVFIKFNKIRKL